MAYAACVGRYSGDKCAVSSATTLSTSIAWVLGTMVAATNLLWKRQFSVNLNNSAVLPLKCTLAIQPGGYGRMDHQLESASWPHCVETGWWVTWGAKVICAKLLPMGETQCSVQYYETMRKALGMVRLTIEDRRFCSLHHFLSHGVVVAVQLCPSSFLCTNEALNYRSSSQSARNKYLGSNAPLEEHALRRMKRCCVWSHFLSGNFGKLFLVHIAEGNI